MQVAFNKAIILVQCNVLRIYMQVNFLCKNGHRSHICDGTIYVVRGTVLFTLRVHGFIKRV